MTTKNIFPETSMANLSPERAESVGYEDARYQEATTASFFPSWSMAYDAEIGSPFGITLPVSQAVESHKKAMQEQANRQSTMAASQGSHSRTLAESSLKSVSELFGKDSNKSFAGSVVDANTTDSVPLSYFGEVAVLVSGRSSHFRQRFTKMEPESQMKILSGTASSDLMLTQFGAWRMSHDDSELLPAWCLVFSPIGMKAEHLIYRDDFEQLSSVNIRLKLRLSKNKRGIEDIIALHRDNDSLPVIHAKPVPERGSNAFKVTLPSGLVIEWDAESGNGPLFEDGNSRRFSQLVNLQVQPADIPVVALENIDEEDLEEVVIAFPSQYAREPLYLVLPKFKERAKVTINPQNMYWPPYDFTKHKQLDVEYTQEVVDLAVMSLAEAEEFANNLWLEYNGKDTLDNSKKIWDGAANAKEAYQLAKGLGGMGVVAYVKPANGQDYVIIKGYKKHLKTLVKGNRWRANNPQVVQLGLGTKNMARNMLKVGLVVDIAFAVAINAVDVYVHDEKTMEDLVGKSGADIVKGVVATGAGTLAAVIVATAGVPLLVSGLMFAGMSVGVGIALDWADNEFGVSDSLVDLLKKGK